MSGKWRTELVYKKLQVRDQNGVEIVVVKKRSQEKASVKCQEEDTVRSKNKVLRLWVDQVTTNFIGNNEWKNSRRQILKGGQAVSTAKKESQARKGTEQVICNQQG